MPYRIIPFVNEQIYHIFNRGVEKRPTFQKSRDYQRYLKSLQYYQLQGPKPSFSKFFQPSIHKIDFSKKIVEILAYCLMPNHFHLLIKQKSDKAITEFVSKLINSYTKYFNTKYDRVGPLFQGQFKAVLIEREEQLIHVSRYIHLNPITSFLVKDLADYKWSSYHEYVDINHNGICIKEEILRFFKSPKEYRQFVLDQIDYGQTLEIIKHKTLEDL